MPSFQSTMICDEAEMDALAKIISKNLKKGAVITLTGELGSGKTTFTKLLSKHLGIQDQVSSPTFTYLHIYDDRIAHFDLYRLKHANEFFSMGFEEYLDSDFITIIEWPDLIKKFLHEDTIHLHFAHHGTKREVSPNVKILL